MATNKKGTGENFVQKGGDVSFGPGELKKACTKKQIRRIADPHIESYKVKESNTTFYRYRRGTDKPIHLGTASYILDCVSFVKLQKASLKNLRD